MAAVLPEGEDPFISTLRSLILTARSKMLRPRLALLGAMAVAEEAGWTGLAAQPRDPGAAFAMGLSMGRHPEKESQEPGWLPSRIYLLAASLELLHTATLIHDDIMDKASTRRGLRTLHTIGDHRRTILSGDYLFSASLLLMSPWLERHHSIAAAGAIGLLCKGEILQGQLQDPEKPSERKYLRQIAGKTAALFVLSLQGGASVMADALGRSDRTSLPGRLGAFAYRIGMAFQINDDLLDVLPGHDTGKTPYRDYRQGLLTMPVVKGLKGPASAALRRHLHKYPPGKGFAWPWTLAALGRHLEESGGIEASRQLRASYEASAGRILAKTSGIPSSAAMLSDLALHLIPHA